MGRAFRLFLVLTLGALAIAAPAWGQNEAALGPERITRFVSEIRVNKDASVTVTETITVVARGRSIRRGIYRDIPTDYTLPMGGRMSADFRLESAERDGRPENSRIERQGAGVRIYLGRAERFLEPGRYTYRITYRMSRMIGFFDGYDEIYWNVTGNQWAFPIQEARAVVTLPESASITQHAAYTGRTGEQGRDYTVLRQSGGEFVAETIKPLAPGEGFTVAVGFTSGVVSPPGGLRAAGYFLSDYMAPLLGLVGLIAIFLYYFIHWSRVGRDPQAGTIIPRFEPPAGMSPAACRYVLRMGHDQKGFAAAVLNIAVKGALRIKEYGRGRKPRYELENVVGADAKRLSPGEAALRRRLFKAGDSVRLNKSNHTKVRPALRAFKDAIENDYERDFFRLNRGYFFVGAGLSVLFLVLIGIASSGSEAILMTVWLGVWGTGCFFLVSKVVNAFRSGNIGGGVFLGLFSVPFLGGLAGGLAGFGALASWSSLTATVGIGGLNLLFFNLLKAPTRDGRKIMDEIEGFKMYLSVAEKERLAQLHPPDKTPELFERYLPYAFALDVEQEWAEQFSGILKAAGEAPGAGGYRPHWYYGRRGWSDSLGGFTSELSSGLSSGIATASTAPSSSSGSGGGGSSGGGGGGGGGGGW